MLNHMPHGVTSKVNILLKTNVKLQSSQPPRSKKWRLFNQLKYWYLLENYCSMCRPLNARYVSCITDNPRLKKYSRIPLIRINSNGDLSGYAGNPDNWIFFFLKIGYIGSLQLGCYYLRKYLHLNLSTTPDLKLQKP